MGKNQETAVAETKTTALANQNLEEWGDSPISARDLIIPKILAMQGLSDLVTEGKAVFGDFVDSVTQEVLGSINKPIEFVPFYLEKSWIVSSRKVGTEKFEFEKYEAVTPQNEGSMPFTEIIGDTEFKNEYAMQFYVLLVSDPSMPKIITFKSTSSRTGKVLSTQMFVRNKAAGLNPAAITMELGGKKEKNDKGTFVVMEVKPKGPTPESLVADALSWMKVVKAGKTRMAPERNESSASDAGYATDETAKF